MKFLKWLAKWNELVPRRPMLMVLLVGIEHNNSTDCMATSCRWTYKQPLQHEPDALYSRQR